jgi:hypothetical protein|tara:strand:+ start:2434 stop:2817 length:384 start_codon:yes stop_codon:yes gene_type:complete
MKGTLVFNISMAKTEQVSDNVGIPLGDAWDSIMYADIKTYELDDDCVHHFLIPTSGKDIVTGECKKCEGRKEFKNTFESVLKHHDPMIDRELTISALQDIKEPDLEKHYVQPLKDMLEFDSIAPSPV